MKIPQNSIHLQVTHRVSPYLAYQMISLAVEISDVYSSWKMLLRLSLIFLLEYKRHRHSIRWMIIALQSQIIIIERRQPSLKEVLPI